MDLASAVVPGFLFYGKVLSVTERAFQAGLIKERES